MKFFHREFAIVVGNSIRTDHQLDHSIDQCLHLGNSVSLCRRHRGQVLINDSNVLCVYADHTSSVKRCKGRSRVRTGVVADNRQCICLIATHLCDNRLNLCQRIHTSGVVIRCGYCINHQLKILRVDTSDTD